MIKVSVIVNDSLYKKAIGSSISFTSILGATEILNNHSDIFSIAKPGIINISVNGSSKDLKFLIFDGIISFLNNEEASILTNKLYDLNIMNKEEKLDLIQKLKDEKVSNYENIVKKIKIDDY